MSLPELKPEGILGVEEEIVPSPPVSVLAIICTVVGLLSPLAFFHPVLWIFPAATVVLAFFAVRQIYQHDPPAVGKGGVQLALLLAAFGGLGGPTYTFTVRGILLRESRPIADQFMAFLQQGQPHKAYQLTRDPNVRLPIDPRAWSGGVFDEDAADRFLWDAVAKDSTTREEFEGFVNRFGVRLLLELKDQARVRYYSSPVLQRRFGNYQVHHLYAVTYEKDGRRRTIFVAIQMERRHLRNVRAADWVITDVFAPVNPDRYPG